MSNIKIYSAALLTVLLSVTSCQDDHELGALLNESDLNFEIKQDLVTRPGGNMVILRNNTPETVSLWEYGTGRSTRAVDTVRFAFKGEYNIKFSAITAGGLVETEPVKVTVTEDYLPWVDDPLWNALSGGVGNEKSWELDIDAKFWDGPLYFYGTNMGWAGECLVEGGDCWNWNPEYAGNTWLMDAGNYGTMTFSLKGGPFVEVNHLKIPARGTESGTYFLDTNAKTLSLTDATPLHDTNRDGCVAGWGNIKLFSLTEDAMQFAVLRTSCEGPCLLVYNYISKEYSENYVPEEQPDPNFNNGNQKELLAITPAKTWKMDTQVPFNWTDLTGNFLNPWSNRQDIINAGWPAYGDADVSKIDGVSIKFTSTGSVTITEDNGTATTGTFTIDEPTNMITFSGVTPSIPIGGWAVATTTAENKWKIVKVEKDVLTDAPKGIWFGRRDPVKSEYMVFHFLLQ